MLSVANKPILMIVVMLSVIMPSVVILNVVVPDKHSSLLLYGNYMTVKGFIAWAPGVKDIYVIAK